MNTVDDRLDLNLHLQRISEAIAELEPLSRTLAAPAPEGLQFLGTIVDNTLALLMAPANAINGGGRNVRFDRPKNWSSLMQAVHRSFFSSILIATEAALAGLCRDRNIRVVSSSRQRAADIVERLRGHISKRDAKDVLGLSPAYPQFADYLEAVLKTAGLSKADAAMWRKYFRALSTVRNKCSHYEVALSSHEIDALREGGFAVAVSADGHLGVNPRMYRQVVEHVSAFLQLILGRIATSGD